jgi:hypothetical protein
MAYNQEIIQDCAESLQHISFEIVMIKCTAVVQAIVIGTPTLLHLPNKEQPWVFSLQALLQRFTKPCTTTGMQILV